MSGIQPDASFWRQRRVLVTGGCGFLGFQIVRLLAELGARVTSYSLRPSPGHPLLEDATVEKRFGNLLDDSDLPRFVAESQIVFHAAGPVVTWGPEVRHLVREHRGSIERILTYLPCEARIVHTSSVVAVGAANGEMLNEDWPWNLSKIGIPYIQAKRESERLALAAAANGRDVVVVNPSYLVGPEDFGLSVMGRFCLAFWKGRIPAAPPGGLNLVDVRDAARGHLLAAERGCRGRRYILGGENSDFVNLLLVLAWAAGWKPRGLWTIPWRLEWFIAATQEWLPGRSREPFPSLQQARLNRYCWYYDSSRAQEELGYSARSLRRSILDAYHWHSARCSFQLRGWRHRWFCPGSSP